jgi:hypothetical protein
MKFFQGIGSGAPKPCAPTGVTSNATSNSLLQATLNLVTDLLVEITDDMSVSGIFLSSDSAQRAVRASAKVDLDGCASCTTVYGPLSSLIIGTAGSVYAANGFSVQQGGTLRIQGVLSGASVRGDRAYPAQNQPILVLSSSSLIADGMLARLNRGASISVDGTFSVLASSKLVLDASNLTLQANSVNTVSGTLQLLNGRLSIAAAPLSIASNGLLLVSGTTVLTSSAGATLSLSALGNFTVDFGASLVASTSNLLLSQASTASSLIAGSVSSSQFNIQGGFLTVSGSVNTQASLLNSLTSASITGSLTSATSTLFTNTNAFLSGILSSSNLTLDSSTSLSSFLLSLLLSLSMSNLLFIGILGSGSLISSTLQVNPRSTLQLGGIATIASFVQLGGEVSLNGQAIVGSARISGAGILNSLGGILNVSASLDLSEAVKLSASGSANLIITGSLSASLRAELALEQSALRVGANLNIGSNSSIVGSLGSSISIGAQLALVGNASALLNSASLAVQTSITVSDHAALIVDANARASASSISVGASSTLAVLDNSLATSTSLTASSGSQVLVGLSGDLSVSSGITLTDARVEVNGRLAGASLRADSSILVAGSQSNLNLDRVDIVGGTISLQGVSTINSSLSLSFGAVLRVLGSLQSSNATAAIIVSDSSVSVAASGSIAFGSLLLTGASDAVVDGSAVLKHTATLGSSSSVTVSGLLEAEIISVAAQSLKLMRSGLLKARELIFVSGTHEIQGTLEAEQTTIGSKMAFPSSGSPAELKSQNVTVSSVGSVSGNMNNNSTLRNQGRLGARNSSTNVTTQNYEQSPSGTMETQFSGSSSSSTTIYTDTAHVAGTLVISTPSSPSLGSQYSVVQCASNCQGSFDSISTSGPDGAVTKSCEWKQTTSTKSIAVLFIGAEGCSDSINGNGSTASDEWRNIIAIVVPCGIIAIAAIATAIIMSNPAWRIKVMPFLIRRNPAKYAKYAGQGVSMSNSQDPLVD